MPIKALLDSADDIPESLKDLYVEDNGKFVLDVEGIDDHPKVRGVITANRENVKKRDQFKAQLAEAQARLAEIPEGFDPEEYLALKSANTNPNDPDAQKRRDEHLQSQRQLYEQKIANIQKKFEADLAALNEQLSERDSYIDKSVVVSGLKDALLSVGVDPDLLDGALSVLRPSVKVHRSDNGDRKAIVETDMGDVEIPAFVKDWAASKGKKYLLKPEGPAPSGNNGRHSAGAKTISRKDWDAMSQVDRMAKSKDGYRVTDAA